MANKLRFHSAVPEDLVSALDYYESISPGLADRFRESVDQRLADIERNPESFPFDIPPARFTKIERFPYVIFFVVAKAGWVVVLAIVHGASDPNRWRTRSI